MQEIRPPIVNQQPVVYKLACVMRCIHKTGTDQIVEEHKHFLSSIGKHLRDDHHGIPRDFDKQLFELKNAKHKFDCLLYEMVYIREIKLCLNVQL